jgi:hypothetical protein
MLGYSLSSFDTIIRVQGTVPGVYLHRVRDANWVNQQKGLVAQLIAVNPVLTLTQIITETR